MAPRADFIDATDLLGAGWQSTPLAQTQTGQWLITIRHGSHGLELSLYGINPGDALAQAADHVRGVGQRLNEALRRREGARLRSRPAQDFDTSALPLFGDAHRQHELF
jgi:hypothetical protein